MKKLTLFICLTATILRSSAQSNAPSQALAAYIAQKMKDSLSLTNSQYDAIYQVNLNLANQKMSLWHQNGARDSLVRRLQQIENQRDTLYYPVLNPAQYQVYKAKKRLLVNAQ